MPLTTLQDAFAAEVAIETKVGTGASTPALQKYLRGSSPGVSAWSLIPIADVTGLQTALNNLGSAVVPVAANTIYAGPATGADANPAFRALVIADIPSLSSLYLPLAGGTLTGALTLPGAPTNALHAATKAYVDANVPSGFAINRAMVSNGSGNLAVSAVTATELGYVGGVTSAIQTQLDAKQASGSYITALTGDVTAAGPGSVAATLATVNSNVGSFGGATKTLSATVNAKGLVTAISEQAIAIAGTQITSGTIDDARLSANVTLLGSSIDLSGAEAAGILAAGRFPALTGDITTVAGALATTLANTAVTAGSYGSASTSLSATVDAKGRLTALSSQAIAIAESQVTGLVSDLAGKANLALSNLASVSINTTLIPQTGVDLGDATHPFMYLRFFGSGSYGANCFKLDGTPTAARVVSFIDATHTVARQDAAQTLTGVQTFSSIPVIQAASPGLTVKTSVDDSGTITLLLNNHTSISKTAIYVTPTGTGFGRGNISFALNSVTSGAAVSASDTRLYLANTGEVGIGTTTIDSGNLLQVAGIVKSTGLAMSAPTATAISLASSAVTFFSVTTAGVQTLRKDTTGALGPIMLLQNSGGSGSGAIDFYTYGAQSVPTLRWLGVDIGGFTGRHDFQVAAGGGANSALVTMLSITNAAIGIGTTAPAALLHAKLSDAVTNAISEVARIEHASSGTPTASGANNFGSRLLFTLQSSTTANQSAASVDAYWTVATHASRTSMVALCAVNNAGALTEVFKVRGDGLITPLDGAIVSTGTTTGYQLGSAASDKLAFWGKTPIVQPSGANQGALTDSTTGTAGFTLSDVGIVFSQAAINSNFASLARLVDNIRTALVNTGVFKGAA